VAISVATALARSKPTLTAPSSAKIGATIHVSTKGLVPRRYAVRLFTHGEAKNDDTCVAWLAKQTKRKVTSISVNVTVPRTLQCFSGFPASADGTMKTIPGAYSIIVSVPQSINTTAASGNDVIKLIKLH